MKDLKLKMIRINLEPSYTEGVLINLTDDEILFDTLEDRVRDINGDGDLLDKDEEKVYGETAIPYSVKGKPYKLKVTNSPKFSKLAGKPIDMVLVEDVPHFTGIRMHWGATAKQSSGCILGGKKTSAGVLKNIGYTQYMVDLLNKYGGKATLEII